MDTISQIKELMNDKTFRANLINDPDTYAQQLGYIKVDGVDFKVVTNTKTIFYCVMLDYKILNNTDLQMFQAAKTGTASTAGSGGTASTLGTVSTIGSACSTAGTGGASLSTVGSAGSVGTVGTQA